MIFTKKHKVIGILCAVMLTLLCAVGLVGCFGSGTPDHGMPDGPHWQEEEKCQHIWKAVFAGDLYSSESSHDYCCEKCGQIKNSFGRSEGQHTFESFVPGATCSECGFTLEESQGLEYELSENGEYYIVVGLGSFSKKYTLENEKEITRSYLMIPQTYNDLPVKEIASNAFSKLSDIRYTYLPSGITKIGDTVFADQYMGTIIVPETVVEVGDSAFGTRATLYYEGASVPTTWNERWNKYTEMKDKLPGCFNYGGAFGFNYGEEGYSWIKLKGNVAKITDINPKFTFFNEYEEWSKKEEFKDDGYGLSDELWNKGTWKPVNIPEQINGLTVTVIGNAAFCASSGSNPNLLSISFPDTIAEIGYGAFTDCTKLTSVDLSKCEDLQVLDNVFGGCTALNELLLPDNLKVFSVSSCPQIERLQLPAEIKEITLRCENLKELTIPDGVETVNVHCQKLTELTLPESVQTVSLYGCTSLKSVTLNSMLPVESLEGLPALEELTFSELAATDTYYGVVAELFGNVVKDEDENNYIKITNRLYVPKSLSKITVLKGDIPDYAFKSMPIKTVVLPDDATYIGVGAFAECASLINVTIPDGVTCIDYWAFGNCTSLTNLVLPNVEQIADEAFAGCSALETMTLPETIEEIPSGCFGDCTALREIVIPDTVTSIWNGAFVRCTALREIVIPGTVTSIEYSAFEGCTALEKVYYTGSAEDWCEIDFEKRNDDTSNPLNYASQLFIQENGNYIEPTSVATTASNIYKLKSLASIQEIIILYSENHTGANMDFSDFPSLENVKLEYFEDEATNITIPDGTTVTYAYNCAKGAVYDFEYATRGDKTILTKYTGAGGNVVLPKTANGNPITEFGKIFLENASIESVVIPTGYTKIADAAFLNCTKLRYVYIASTVTEFEQYAFYNNDFAIHVTDERWSDYQYEGRGVYLSSETEVPYGVIDNSSYLIQYVNIHFDEESNLLYSVVDNKAVIERYFGKEDRVTIPATLGGYSVASISHYSFSGNTELSAITFADSITGIDSSAFANCRALSVVTLSKSLRVINFGAFRGCTLLQSIRIPASVNTIGNLAFEGTGIETVTFDHPAGWAAYEHPADEQPKVVFDEVTIRDSGAQQLIAYKNYFFINLGVAG